MLVKFFRHGTGSAAGPLNYLLGSDRQRADAKVLYGDPTMTKHLINVTPFKQKYKSGVLSFTEQADSFTDEQKMDIMQRFEQTLFVGLEPDQYDILWIEHCDKDKVAAVDEYGDEIEGSLVGGRLELNFLIPCMELRSGKSLQPFYAGADLVRVNAFKNIINHEYKLTNPCDPLRKREVNPYVDNAPRPTPFDVKKTTKKADIDEDTRKDAEIIKNPTTHSQLKEAIDRQMLRLLEKANIRDRYSVSDQLRRWGLTVKRQTERSISVFHPNINKNIRLKGYIYEQNFDYNRTKPVVKAMYQDAFEHNSNYEHRQDVKTWQIGMEKKQAYHQTLYGDIPIPEPLDLGIKATLPEHQLEVSKHDPESPTPLRSYNPRLSL